MTLARVIDQLDTYGIHSFYTGIIEGDTYARKKLEYRYSNKDERMILLIRTDVTKMYQQYQEYSEKLKAALTRAYTDALPRLLNYEGLREKATQMLQ